MKNAFCPDQCCITLVLGHCTPVWWADILRSICNDTSGLSAYFAEQHRTVRNAFCLDQCCSALVLGHCTPIWWANTQRSICTDTAMLSACFAEKQKAVRKAFCLDQCCSALVLGHCTPVWWAEILRCLCSDTTMLWAWFAEQHRTVRNAFCLDQCCRRQNAFLTAFCFSAKQADSIAVSVQIDLWVFAHHIGVQCPSTSALQHWSRQNAFLTVLCCSANQAHSIVVSLQRHLKISAHHTGVQWPSTSALQHWSRQIAFLTALCCYAKQADSIVVSLERHLWIFCKTHRCTVCHHQCTKTLVRTLSEKQNAFLTAFCFSAKQADSIVVSLQRHLWIFCKHTGVQCPITNALQHWSGLCQRNKMHSSLPFVSLQNRLTAL